MTTAPTMTADLLRVVCDVRCLADGGYRGFSRYTTELVDALRRRPGVEVVLVTDVPLELPPPLAGMDIRTVTGAREWKREQRGLPRVVADVGGDVLLAPANRGLPLFGGPSVLTLHDAVEWNPEFVPRPRGRSRLRFGYASAASLIAATRIITVSQHSADMLHSTLGLDGSRVRVVTEAPSPHFMRPFPEEERARVRAAIGLPDRYVLYLGGFDQKKNVETLVRAWARRDPDVVPDLVLAGDMGGGEAQAMREVARDVGSRDERLHAVGYVADEHLRALYGEADLFVFPAIAEGFGLPAVEAMACGTPTLVADAGALPESTRGGALRFVPGDEAALGLILRRLFTDVEARRDLGRRGRVAVASRSWDDVAAETEGVLRDAVAASRRDRLALSVASVRHLRRWIR